MITRPGRRDRMRAIEQVDGFVAAAADENAVRARRSYRVGEPLHQFAGLRLRISIQTGR